MATLCSYVITCVPCLNFSRGDPERTSSILPVYRIYRKLLIFKLLHTVFHVNMSMGHLFSGWQRNKCIIVRFLTLNGLRHFVFWSRVEWRPCPQLGSLSPQRPSGKLLQGASPSTHPSMSSVVWLNDVSPFEARVPCISLMPIYLMICGFSSNSRCEIYCWFSSWQHSLLGWWI